MKKNKKKSVLVLAAHPDDEVLGCGGALVKLKEQNYELHIQIFGEGPTSRGSGKNPALAEAKKAAQILGAKLLPFFNLKDQNFDQYNFLELTKQTNKVIEKVKPSIIFTHHPKDLNRDHQIVSEVCCVCSRSVPGSQIEEIYFWENLSSFEWSPHRHEFRPQAYFNIEKQIDKKLKALKAYQSELRDFPHPRSLKAVEALAQLRGSESGFLAAEVFEVFRSRKA